MSSQSHIAPQEVMPWMWATSKGDMPRTRGVAPTLGWDQLAANQVNAVEYTVQPGEQEELDFRSFV